MVWGSNQQGSGQKVPGGDSTWDDVWSQREDKQSALACQIVIGPAVIGMALTYAGSAGLLKAGS